MKGKSDVAMSAPDKKYSITVLIVEPEKLPYIADIGSDIGSMEDAVGGSIEVIYPFEEPVAIICNENGKLLGKKLNRALLDSDGDVYDIVAGKFFVCGVGADDFTSLTPELAEKFKEKFAQPEDFFRRGNRIVVVPTKPKARSVTYGEHYRALPDEELAIILEAAGFCPPDLYTEEFYPTDEECPFPPDRKPEHCVNCWARFLKRPYEDTHIILE